jgi:rhomboid protease GluP
METRLLLWVYLISAAYTLAVVRRRGRVASPRVLVVLAALLAVSTLGLVRPGLASPALWCGTVLFVTFLVLPGLLVRMGRSRAARGRFGGAARHLAAACFLIPAGTLRAERDLYRAVREGGGAAHPQAGEIRRRLRPVVPPRRTVVGPALLAPILAIGLAAFVLGDSRSMLTLMMLGANHGPLVEAGEVFRLFTATFLHIGLLHLLLNAAAILLFTVWVEPVFGAMRTLLLFLSAALAGNVASYLAYGGAGVISAGASGGAMGLVGAAAALALDRRRNPIWRQRLPSLLLVVGATMALGVLEAGIDNGAHGGGLLAGFLAGNALRRPGAARSVAVRIAAGLLVAATTASFVWMAIEAPGWNRLVEWKGPGFSFVGPSFLVPDGEGEDLRFHCVPVGLIEVAVLETDGREALENRLSETVDRSSEADVAPRVTLEELAPAPRHPGWMRAAVTLTCGHQAERTEVYLGRRGSRTALVTFTLPHPDRPLRRAVVHPVLESLRLD